jgi:hypothetical protein
LTISWPGWRGRFGIAAGVLALATLLAGCGSSSSAARSYGALPSFLPTDAIAPDSILTGSAASPALTVEGDSVKVEVDDASAIALVTGPVVPGEGLPFQAAATTCTWTVTLSGATAKIPIAVSDFSALDHLGVVYQVTAVPGSAGPPADLGPGQTATFELRTVMPSGEGLMRWAPAGEQVAAWDFEVEND